MQRPGLTQRIGEHEQGQRLDRYLRKLLRKVPLGALFRHLREQRIQVDGKRAAPDLRLLAGMEVELRLPAADLAAVAAAPARRPVPPRPAPGERKRRGAAPKVVLRDRDILVVDKPAGMAVQPGSGHVDDHLLSWLDKKGWGERSATFAPAPAHRLDRGTSGLCIVGLTPAGLRGATAAFRDDLATKVYYAVVHGAPRLRAGSIEAPLRELPGATADGPKVAFDPRGKPARTDYEVIAVRGERALLRLQLHTGRTHQIRAHMAYLGHPIVGDRRYGSPVRMGRMFLLHAAELSLPHPISGEPLVLRAPLPPTFGFAGETPR